MARQSDSAGHATGQAADATQQAGDATDRAGDATERAGDATDRAGDATERAGSLRAAASRASKSAAGATPYPPAADGTPQPPRVGATPAASAASATPRPPRAGATPTAPTAGANPHPPAVAKPGVIPPPPWSRESGTRRTRADKPVLSREAIVAAAIRVIDDEGFDAVSMRRVAQEFGTGAASLYAYVANKDELMDLIVDEIMRESEMGAFREPSDDVGEWQEQVKEMVRAGYRTLTAHRDIAKAMLGRIPFGPNGLRAIENSLRLLRAHGMPDYVAAYAGDLIGQYMVGSAIEDYMWQERYPDATPEQVGEAMGEVGDYLESLPKEEFPNLTELARVMVGETQGGAERAAGDPFELGLDILVRGLSTFLDPSAHERRR